MEDVLEKQFSEIRSSVEAAGGDDGAVAAAIDEYIKRDVYDGDAVTDAANLTRLTITTTLETSATMYSIMNMCVLKSTAHYFVTSDHPVVWIDPRVRTCGFARPQNRAANHVHSIRPLVSAAECVHFFLKLSDGRHYSQIATACQPDQPFDGLRRLHLGVTIALCRCGLSDSSLSSSRSYSASYLRPHAALTLPPARKQRTGNGRTARDSWARVPNSWAGFAKRLAAHSPIQTAHLSLIVKRATGRLSFEFCS
jgi:hypothetical protein